MLMILLTDRQEVTLLEHPCVSAGSRGIDKRCGLAIIVPPNPCTLDPSPSMGLLWSLEDMVSCVARVVSEPVSKTQRAGSPPSFGWTSCNMKCVKLPGFSIMDGFESLISSGSPISG